LVHPLGRENLVSRSACFAGSFDPVTRGHLDLIRRAASLFDRVVIAVGTNADKRPWFTAAERVAMLAAELGELSGRVTAEVLEGLVVDFCDARRIGILVRGIRQGQDAEGESVMALANRRLAPHIETVCLFSAPEHLMISSRLVKEIARGGGPLDSFVTANVAESIRQHLARESSA
jgi:pantetheine-phosphate adenylyltransferase